MGSGNIKKLALAVMELGYTGVEVAKKLKINSAAVSRSLDRVRKKHKEETINIISKILDNC